MLLTKKNGTIVTDGNYNVIFNIYANELDGAAIYTETQSVTVANRVANLFIGDASDLSTNKEVVLTLNERKHP